MHVPSLLLGATVSLVLVSVYLTIYGHDVVYPFLGTSKQGKWIDLTHDFSEETLYWPTSDSFRLETAFAGTTPAGFYYSAYKYSASEHGGTHLGIKCNEIAVSNSSIQTPQDISQRVKVVLQRYHFLG